MNSLDLIKLFVLTFIFAVNLPAAEKESCPELNGKYEVVSCQFPDEEQDKKAWVNFGFGPQEAMISDKEEAFSRFLTIKQNKGDCNAIVVTTRACAEDYPVCTANLELSTEALKEANKRSYPKTKVKMTESSILIKKRYMGRPKFGSEMGILFLGIERGYRNVQTLKKVDNSYLSITNKKTKTLFAIGYKTLKESCLLKKID